MPRSTSDSEPSVKERVAAVLELIRPAIQTDGGDIELLDVDPDGVVQVRLHGACIGCPSSEMTLKLGIERNLREQVPEVSEVVCV
jgi:Fe-S cluster biogenesis protein NfuA